tara:strand:+ start:2405 stop:2635 length:231 start_codon:yes stop_codon:yes gene_type:complete
LIAAIIVLRHSRGMKVKLNRDNRVTVPQALRDQLGLKPGDPVEFVVRGDGLLLTFPRHADPPKISHSGSLDTAPGE